ncbi:hypothetical protein EDD11_002594 [Mortierella claussenii]|nr:hypothetical protein EDD11_002594 [Mortierella claussenii]
MQQYEQQINEMAARVNKKPSVTPDHNSSISSNSNSNSNATSEVDAVATHATMQPSYQSNSSNATPLKEAVVSHPQEDLSFSVAGPIIGGLPLPTLSIHNKSIDKTTPTITSTPIEPPNQASIITHNSTTDNSPATFSAPSATTGRRASITDTVLAGATTAAATAATAASSVVEAARRLVLHEENEESLSRLDLSSSQDHQGLEFQQRKLSNKARNPSQSLIATNPPHMVSDHEDVIIAAVTPTTAAATDSSITSADTTRVNSHDAAMSDMSNAANPSSLSEADDAVFATVPTAAAATMTSANPQASESAVIPSVGATTMPTSGVADLNNTTFAAQRGNSVDNNNNSIINTASNGSPLVISGDQHPDPSKNRQDATTEIRPTTNSTTKSPKTALNTMYVAGRGEESSRHQAMGVDLPSVSRVEGSRAKISGLGVDVPRVVGQPIDPKIHRTGGLHVDGKHDEDNPHHPRHGPHDHDVHVPHHEHDHDEGHGAPIQTSKDNNQVIYGNQHHMTQNTLPEAQAAISKNPFEAHMSHHRGSSSSGLKVDHPLIPTAALAGSGSSDNTNHNRPDGVHNSAINVDRAGAADHKRSGMGVDSSAIDTHHMATVDDPYKRHHRDVAATGIGATAGVAATGTDDSSSSRVSSEKHFPEDDRESLFDKVKGAFRRRSSIHSSRSHATPRSSLDKGKGTVATSSTPPSNAVPSEYDIPVPQVAPDEHVVWVKRITKTDYYDDEAGDEAPVPSQTQHHESHRRGSKSSGTFFDRLRGRHASPTPVDKGKQRT